MWQGAGQFDLDRFSTFLAGLHFASRQRSLARISVGVVKEQQ